MKNDRKQPSSNLLKRLGIFYGGRRCVVSGLDQNSDWHHLDDNPGNTCFSNLIPLGRDHNNKLEIYRRYQGKEDVWKGYDIELEPGILLITSRKHFISGDIGLAYGCSRLAVWMINLYPSLFGKYDRNAYWELVFQALSCARHADSQELIEDIIGRDIEKHLATLNGDKNNVFLIALEFASILQEYLCISDADELFVFIDDKLKKMPYERADFLSKMMRRISLSNIIKSNNIAKTIDMLSEADKLVLSSSANLHVGVANARAWLYLAKSNPVKAIDTILPIIDNIFGNNGSYKKEIVTPWNALESIITYNRALEMIDTKNNGKAKKSAFEQLKYTLNFFRLKCIGLRPIAYNLSVSSDGEKSYELSDIYDRFIVQQQNIINKSLYLQIKRIFSQLVRLMN